MRMKRFLIFGTLVLIVGLVFIHLLPAEAWARQQITVQKTQDPPIPPAGGNALLKIEVSNVSANANEVCEAVEVIDPAAPDCYRFLTGTDLAPDGILDPGESVSYDCKKFNVPRDFTNTAIARCYIKIGECLYYRATARDSVIVDVYNGAINITKDAEFEPGAGGTPGISITKSQVEEVCIGSEVEFEIVVTNTGDGDLTNVVVTDPQAPNCSRQIGFLAEGDSESYFCTDSDVAACFDNTATVTATGQGFTGGNVTFTIMVENTGDVGLTNVRVFDSRVPECARSWDDIKLLENNDGVPVGDELTPGESFTYTCDAGFRTETFTNIASVRADGEACPGSFARTARTTVEINGGDPIPVEDSATSPVVVSGLIVSKTAEPPTVECTDTDTSAAPVDECLCPCDDGGSDTDTNGVLECIASKVTYTYTVTNPGCVPLAYVAILDDNGTPDDPSDDFQPVFVGGDLNNDGLLDPGEIWEYKSAEVCLCDETTNTVSATGELPDGTICAAEAQATVLIVVDCDTDTAF